ncbi:hypothetical protein GQ44DRAFT_460181 [Phaeosphaeriaceae sp. PMI808]|nr:hypothetical protein GQ44DRAFT_460181 [Phaeosphaeriaceae sp. PMI808]
MTSDFSPKSLQHAFSGQHLVINTMSGGNFGLQVFIIDALVAANVKRFIPHEFGHDTLNEHVQSRIPNVPCLPLDGHCDRLYIGRKSDQQKPGFWYWYRTLCSL